MDLLRLTNKLSQTQYNSQTSILRKSIRQTPPLLRVLLKLLLRRQRYSFQLFKYLIMFPGESQMSQDLSIDTYDKLIFGDDAIHSMVKIYQSKQLQNKIWAFINIKALKYLQSCKIFTKKISRIYVEKLQKPVKSKVFQNIKQYNILIRSSPSFLLYKQKQKYVDQGINTQHRQKLSTKKNIYEVKIDGRNNINSNILIDSRLDEEQSSINNKKSKQCIENKKLTESMDITGQLLQSVDHIPSRISIKTQSVQQHKRQSKLHEQKQINQQKQMSQQKQTNKQKQFKQQKQTNQQIKSQTRIRFTYTSPTKQQVIKHLSRQKKSLVNSNQMDRRKQNDRNKYKYTIPKMLDTKRLCCQNLCGMTCGENCSYNCKQNRQIK